MTKEDLIVEERLDKALRALMAVRLASSTRKDGIWDTARKAYEAIEAEILNLRGFYEEGTNA